MIEVIYLYTIQVVLVVFFLDLLGLLFFLRWRGFFSKKKFRPKMLLELAASIVVATIIFFFLGIKLIFLEEECNAVVAVNFSYFNQHMQALCIDRVDKSECPMDVVQLKAFNPEKYQEIERCTHAQYRFEPKTKQGIWSVFHGKKDQVLVSGVTSTPEFLLLDENDALAKGYWMQQNLFARSTQYLFPKLDEVGFTAVITDWQNDHVVDGNCTVMAGGYRIIVEWVDSKRYGDSSSGVLDGLSCKKFDDDLSGYVGKEVEVYGEVINGNTITIENDTNYFVRVDE